MIRRVKRLLDLAILIVAAFLLTNILLNNFGYLLYKKITYVDSVHVTPEKQELTDTVLSKLNTLTDKKVVKFEGIRPIILIEAPNDMDALGVAYVTLGMCVIKIIPGLDPVLYSWVLVHEYIHCFNIDHHEDDPCDIMYPTVETCTTNDNIRMYLRKIGNDYE